MIDPNGMPQGEQTTSLPPGVSPSEESPATAPAMHVDHLGVLVTGGAEASLVEGEPRLEPLRIPSADELHDRIIDPTILPTQGPCVHDEQIEVRILSDTTLKIDGKAAELKRGSARFVLGALLLRGGRPSTSEELKSYGFRGNTTSSQKSHFSVALKMVKDMFRETTGKDVIVKEGHPKTGIFYSIAYKLQLVDTRPPRPYRPRSKSAAAPPPSKPAKAPTARASGGTGGTGSRTSRARAPTRKPRSQPELPADIPAESRIFVPGIATIDMGPGQEGYSERETTINDIVAAFVTAQEVREAVQERSGQAAQIDPSRLSELFSSIQRGVRVYERTEDLAHPTAREGAAFIGLTLAHELLLRAHQDLVTALIEEYGGAGLRQELTDAGQQALTRAIRTFMPEAGQDFSVYAEAYIWQAMQRVQLAGE